MPKYAEAKDRQDKAVPSTDPEAMLEDAKTYAKTEFTSIKILLDTMKVKYKDEDLAKAWIQVKYNQIAEKRTNRTTYFD